MDIRDTPTRRASRGVGVVAKDEVAAWHTLTQWSLASGGLDSSAVLLIARTRRSETCSCDTVALTMHDMALAGQTRPAADRA